MRKNKQIGLAILGILLIGQNAFSQDNGLTDLSIKFDKYTHSLPLEKLYVHTDKSFYTAGEIVWFRIYKLGDSSIANKVAYVEILDAHDMAVAKAKIEMDEKGGSGSIQLPLTLNSGYYTFRAYTNWMKNFGAGTFFEKRLSLVNTLKGLSPSEKNNAQGTVDLFPEGGNLVSGMPSRVAFKISDAEGKGTSGKGFLIDEKNDTLIQLAPYQFGLGSFDFVPDAAHSYKVVFVFDDNSIVAKPLPQIYTQGYAMHLEEEGQNIRVIVRTNIVSGYPEMFLIAQNHRQIKLAKRNVISNGAVVFSFDKSELGAGISQLTVFNNEKQPVCERLFFIQPERKTDLEIKSAKENYSNRELVSLSLSSPSSLPADLSLSVYQLDSLQTRDASDISSYVWLESELGRIENPQYYLSNNSDEAKKAADLLMLTRGWRKFDWTALAKGTPVLKFPPEISGQIIVCKVTEVQTGKPVSDIQVFLSIPETSYKLYCGSSDDSGMVRISVKDFFGNSELILQTNRPESYRVELLSPFFDRYSPSPHPSFVVSNSEKTTLENYSIDMQAQHIYSADSIQKFLAPEIQDTFPFFGQALYTYNLDSYTRFTTMEEVLREYVREINVGVKGSGDLKLKLFNEDDREYYTNDILVVVDGVPVFNTAKIFSIDPLKIHRLDIITKNYVVGTFLFHGLASFSTYKTNYEGMDLDPKAISLDYEGLQLKREFYSPDYSTSLQKNSRIPDLRTTLFWSPDVHPNQKIQFYTGDNKGKYLIVVQGINRKGEPISSSSTLEVK